MYGPLSLYGLFSKRVSDVLAAFRVHACRFPVDGSQNLQIRLKVDGRDGRFAAQGCDDVRYGHGKPIPVIIDI